MQSNSAACSFYRAMHCDALYIVQNTIAIACRLSVCDVGGSGPNRLEILETNWTDN